MEKLKLNQGIIERLVDYSDKNDVNGKYYITSKNQVLSLLDKEVALPFYVEITSEVKQAYYDFYDGIEETEVMFNKNGSVHVVICRHACTNNAEYDYYGEEFEEYHYSSIEKFINDEADDDRA